MSDAMGHADVKTFVLPGMGADHRMYGAPAWRALEDARFLDWPKYAGESSIAEIAGRVILDAGIEDDAIVMGSSLGGVVACEISRRRRLRSLVLIGSAAHREELSWLLEALSPLVSLAPISFIQALAGKMSGELGEMFASGQADFIRAACLAIFEWTGLDRSRIVPVRLHGRKDWVIPLPPDSDFIVEGGHLIAMTHSDECVIFLKERLPGMV
jgi:pimeloyl-ACP methyl ester carboxylesterase